MNPEFREYSDADEANIFAILNDNSDIDKEQWKWKIFNTPQNKSRIWLIENDSSIIGHLALQGINLNLLGQIKSGCHAVDLIINEDYRRKGLFVKLGKTALDNAGESGIDYAIGFPNKEALGGHLKYGWKEIGSIPRALKVLDVPAYLKRKEKQNNPLLKASLKLKSKKIVPSDKFVTKEVESFDDGVNKIVEIALNSHISVSRSKDYLNWRYSQAPHRKYIKIIALENEAVQGYAVGYVSKGDNPSAYIVDIVATKKDVSISLISSLETIFRSKNADAVYTWVPNYSAIKDALKNTGFIFRSPTQPFIVRINQKEIEDELIYSFDKWFITMGDSDLH